MRLYNVVFRYRGEVHLALIEARNMRSELMNCIKK